MVPPANVRRKPLSELCVNKPLWDRPKVERPPITLDKENERAVLRGIANGDYQIEDILDLTNASSVIPVPRRDNVADSDDEEGIEALARDLDVEAWATTRLGDRLAEHHLDEGDDDDDDARGIEQRFSDVIDEDLDQDEEFEYDNRGDVHDHIPVTNFDAASLGLKEINNLAHFSVSSHKPGNGVEELLNDDLDKYWQSDGQQPHLLTIHFLRRVEIRAIRFYVDYNQDESYTPTFVILSAGTGHHDLIEFVSMPLANPVGWQEVDLSDVGGGDDEKSLCCWIVQMQVKENHQNGKDTHIRGIKIYALDENANMKGEEHTLDDTSDLVDDAAETAREKAHEEGDSDLYQLLRSPRKMASARSGSGMSVPDFMRDPEIR